MDCLRELNDGSASSSASSSSWSGGRAPNAGAAAYPLPWLLLDLHQLLREATPAQAERNARQQEQLYNDVQKAAEDKRQGRKMAARLFGAIGGRGRGGNCGELADLLCSNEGMLELFAVSIDHMDGHAAEGVMGAVWEQFGRRARTLQSLQSSLGSGSSQQQDTAATPPPPPPAAVAAAEKAAQALRACKRLTFTQLQFDYNWSVHGADIAASLQGASVLGHSLAAGTRRLAAALLEHYATAGVHIWMVWNQWDFIPDAQIWIHDIAVIHLTERQQLVRESMSASSGHLLASREDSPSTISGLAASAASAAPLRRQAPLPVMPACSAARVASAGRGTASATIWRRPSQMMRSSA